MNHSHLPQAIYLYDITHRNELDYSWADGIQILHLEYSKCELGIIHWMLRIGLSRGESLGVGLGIRVGMCKAIHSSTFIIEHSLSNSFTAAP